VKKLFFPIMNQWSLIIQNVSPGLLKVLSNTSWLLADRLLQMGLGLFVGVWVARYLGPSQFGLYNYALSFVSMFSPLVIGGLNSIVVRDAAQKPQDKNQILGASFGLGLMGSAVALLLSIALITKLSPDEPLAPWLVGIMAAGTLFQSFDAIDFWFQSQVRSKHVVFARQFSYVAACGLRVALIQFHAPLIAFAGARFAELLLSAVGLIIMYQSQGNNIRDWQFRLPRIRSLLKESFPLMLSGLAVFIYSKTDQIMLGSLLADKSQLGFYAVSVRVAEIFDFLPVIIASSVLPKLSQLKAEGRDYLGKIQVYFDLMLYLWLAIAIPISLLAPWIIHVLYGDFYAPAGGILGVYVWAQFGSNLGVARSTYLTIEGKLHYALYFSVAGAGLNVMLNYYLIPRYEAIGATVATLITYFVVIILTNFWIPDLQPVGKLILRSLNPYSALQRVLQLCR
jgi:O-antigen/teichoic acid export membrane protein